MKGIIISSPEHLHLFRAMLGDGSQWGVSFGYAVHPEPKGLAQAFRLDKAFIGQDPVCLILGDNTFSGSGLRRTLAEPVELEKGATVVGCPVKDPERYGVVEFDQNNRVVVIVYNLKPSPRGELEITDINKTSLELNEMHVKAWGVPARVARRGHAREPAPGAGLRPGDRATAGADDPLPARDCVADGLHRRRAARTAWRGDGIQRLRQVTSRARAGPDGRALGRVPGAFFSGALLTMEIERLKVPGVLPATPRRHGDERGYFTQTYSKPKPASAGVRAEFVQDNQSRSDRIGTLCGLHFQRPPHAQGKLVRVIWNDPTLALLWPIDREPWVSVKDERLREFARFESPFVFSGD